MDKQSKTRKNNISKFFDKDLRKIINGYKTLNYDGKFKHFLNAVAFCRVCMEGNRKIFCKYKIPINRLVNNLDIEKDTSYLVKQIKANDANFRKKFNPNPKIHKLKFNKLLKRRGEIDYGFSIGVCGWTDAGLLLSPKNKIPEIMIVAGDWYPILSQEGFILDNEKEGLVGNGRKGGSGYKFWSTLEFSPEKVKRLIGKYGLYVTQAMLCYRNKGRKSGMDNIDSISFENCSSFLKEQIRIIKPRLIITWGPNATKYVSKALIEMKNLNPLLHELLMDQKLRKVMIKEKNDIPFKIDNKEGFFHPLYHPCMINSNRWKGDYAKLKILIERLFPLKFKTN